MKIGVVGGGVVGSATARTYLEWADEVRVYDLRAERRSHNLHEVLECDLVFVCLPTPLKDGSLECDLSVVEGFFRDMIHGKGLTGILPKGGYSARNFVLRSTVPIGTTRMLARDYGLTNIVHSPEFLTARCAMTDAQFPSRNVIGLPNGWTERNQCGELLNGLYANRFPGCPVHIMTSDESEAVKLFQNGLFATTVAYWNEVRCLADEKGLNWVTVIKAVLADGRIPRSHCRVPGPDGRRGFGGSCLPKDLSMLVDQLGEAGVVANAALRRNETIDRKRND